MDLLGDVSTDVRDAMIEKATYYSQIGDKEEALALYKKGKKCFKCLFFFLNCSSGPGEERHAWYSTGPDVCDSSNWTFLQRQKTDYRKRRKGKENDR